MISPEKVMTNKEYEYGTQSKGNDLNIKTETEENGDERVAKNK